jgi:hypothetical protein
MLWTFKKFNAKKEGCALIRKTADHYMYTHTHTDIHTFIIIFLVGYRLTWSFGFDLEVTTSSLRPQKAIKSVTYSKHPMVPDKSGVAIPWRACISVLPKGQTTLEFTWKQLQVSTDFAKFMRLM